jgi:hypothetical protein
VSIICHDGALTGITVNVSVLEARCTHGLEAAKWTAMLTERSFSLLTIAVTVLCRRTCECRVSSYVVPISKLPPPVHLKDVTV